MKLWCVHQEKNRGYDTFDSFVVAAETQDEARLYHPLRSRLDPDDPMWSEHYNCWCHHRHVSVEYLGEARPGHPPGIVIASFNAG